MKTKCALVEDNPDDLDLISRTIEHLSCVSNHTFELFPFHSSQEVDLSVDYDLYILDIDLPGENGFQLANRIYKNQPDAAIIFCTGHEDLVFDSFRLNPFYFVRKSFLKDDLIISLRKYIQAHEKERMNFLISSTKKTLAIPFSDILYFEISHNDLYIHTTQKEYSERKTIKELLQLIPEGQFIQVSQSYVVNAAHITELSDNKVHVSNGQIIEVSRRNIKSVRDKYTRYLTR